MKIDHGSSNDLGPKNLPPLDSPVNKNYNIIEIVAIFKMNKQPLLSNNIL